MGIRSSSVTNVYVRLLFLMEPSSHVVLLHTKVLSLRRYLFSEDLLLVLFFFRVESLLFLSNIASEMRVCAVLTVMCIASLCVSRRVVLVRKSLVTSIIHIRKSSYVRSGCCC